MSSPDSSSATGAEKHPEPVDAESGATAGDEHPARRRERRNAKRQRKTSQNAEHSHRGGKKNRRQRRAEKRNSGSEEGADRKARKTARREARKQTKEEARSATENRTGETVEKHRKKKEGTSKKGNGREKSKKDRSAENARGRKAREQPAEDDLSHDDDADLEDGLGGDEATETDDDAAPARFRQNTFQNPVATAVFARSKGAGEILFERLKDRFSVAGIQLTSATSDAALVVSLGDGRDDEGVRAKRGVRLQFVEPEGGSTDCEPRKMEAEGGTVALPLLNLVRRFPEAALLFSGENLTEFAADVLATAARDALLTYRGGTVLPPTVSENLAPDRVAAIEAAKDLTELLKGLSWRSGSPPASIDAALVQHVIESFLNGAIGYRERGENKTLPLPFDWAARPVSRNVTYAAHGLDFAASVLTYWFQKANRSRSKRIAQIDAVVKQKNVTASAILDRVGQIILEITAESVKLPPEAWQLNVAIRRARAMVLYLLCCRMAAQRKIKFDESGCTPIFRSLVSTLDRIRWAGYGKLGTLSALLSTLHIAGLALPLRNTLFGANLSDDSLETLKRHLAAGLSPDGVWRSGFADHDRVFQALRKFLGDLRTAGILSSELADQVAQMARFTVSFLRHDGYSPPLGGLPPKRYRFGLAGAQVVLRSKKNKRTSPVGGDDLQQASLFSQGGYFTSRTPEKKGAISSHLVVSAGGGLAGKPTFSFSCGPSFILVGGGSTDRKAAEEIRRATQRNPAAHNAIRIDDLVYPSAASRDSGRLQIERAWEEKSWAGARLVNGLFPPSNIVRTMIHLKPLHALLVVDEMHAGDVPRKFEQFWHLGPDLKPRQRQSHHFRLSMDEGNPGGVIVAFDNGYPAVPRIGGPEPIGWTANARGEVVRNLYFVREMTASHAITAAFFRYTASAARHDISVEPISGGWKAALLCEGREIAFTSEDDQVKLAS